METMRAKSAILQRVWASLQVRPLRLASGLPILVLFAATIMVPGARGQAVQTFSAYRDKTGQHPTTVQATSARYGVTLKCVSAKSDVANAQPAPGCHVVVPHTRYSSTDLFVGQVFYFNDSVPVTLTCTGPGNRVDCTATVGPRDPRHAH